MISLKQRFTIYFSILFSAILAVVMIIVLYIFAQIRENEFKMRIEEKASSTAELLSDLNVSKQDLLKILDQNSIDKLYNDRILVYDDALKVIYSSVSGTEPIISAHDLRVLQEDGSFYYSEQSIGRYGKLFKLPDNKKLYVLITAEDKSGHRLFLFLSYLLLGAFFLGTVSVIVLSLSLSGKILLPLEHFQQRITDISENKMHIRLTEKQNNDEIDKLARAFNEMMGRIDSSYKQQKEFTDNASHELRTPVTRISMQIQNLISSGAHSEKTLHYLHSILEDANQMADTISSLLLLSKIDSGYSPEFLPPCRLDEIIFEAVQLISKDYPDAHTVFNIENESENDLDFEIKGDFNLLKTVFVNLFKNAYLYSSDKSIKINVVQSDGRLKVMVLNNGEIIDGEDRENLFQAFARGKNSKNIQGTGLGLRITERILHYHHAEISYEALPPGTNCFTLSF
jgi:two-component system, OmpR family, sensor histidine kinase ArlS